MLFDKRRSRHKTLHVKHVSLHGFYLSGFPFKHRVILIQLCVPSNSSKVYKAQLESRTTDTKVYGTHTNYLYSCTFSNYFSVLWKQTVTVTESRHSFVCYYSLVFHFELKGIYNMMQSC